MTISSYKSTGRFLIFYQKYILILLIAVCYLNSSWGQSGGPNSNQLPPAAQEAINKDIMATKVPDYLLAVRYFEDARKAAPLSPEVFFNLGLAESNIPGRELRAICWFGAYLAANPTAANAAAVREQINTLDVKNKSNVRRLLNMLQDVIILRISAKLWTPGRGGMFDLVDLWLEMSDVSAATKAANSVDRKDTHLEFFRNIALLDIAQAQLETNELEGARKTVDQISYNKEHCNGLLMIADSQLTKADTANAQKTLAYAFKIGVKIHTDPSLGITTMESQEMERLSFVAESQAENR